MLNILHRTVDVWDKWSCR